VNFSPLFIIVAASTIKQLSVLLKKRKRVKKSGNLAIYKE